LQIARIRAYRVALPLHEGSYKWSGGKSVSIFDSTLVEVETEAGLPAGAKRSGSTCPPTGRECARASRSWGLISSASTPELGRLNQRMDARSRPSVREVRHRHGRWASG
jgi:hypothetical protein